MQRLGIFCTYDADGIIDDYICYLLQEINKILSHLTIVCNGKLTSEGKNKLSKFTDDLIVRDNSGFDMEAWKQGILKNKSGLKDYDEIILFNDSFFGPLYPFEKIFSKMDETYPQVDFWGITIHGKSNEHDNLCPYGYIPEHLQSYFLVVRKKMLQSAEFFSYWEKAEIAKTMDEAVKLHEVCFTKNFSDLGFKYAAYCDTRELEKDCDVKINHYLFSMDKLLKDYNCPLIKKKIFLLNRNFFISENYGNIPHESLDFIESQTNYDTALIWQNLLRKKNIGDIKSDLSLDYILSLNVRSEGKVNLKDAVVIAHLYYEDLMPVCVKYLCNIPKDIKIIVTVSAEQKKKIVEQLFEKVQRTCEVRLVSARGRDLSALYVGCADVFKNYKYLCFIHDKKSVRKDAPINHGEAFFRLLWDNVLPSEIFIKNTLATFENNPLLGILAPPQPYNGDYRSVFFAGKFWTTDTLFKTTLQLADRLNIPQNLLDIKIASPAIGSVFWCRTESIKKLTSKAWTAEDFPEEPMPTDGTISHALERILPYVAQNAGFYTGQLMSDKFAKDEIENFICFAKMFHDTPFQSVSSITTWVKYNVPRKYWFLLRPFKKFLDQFINLVKKFR